MSPSLPKRVLYYGKDEPLPEQIPLRAGPLSLIYEAGNLRYIKLGGREVIRRIYAAVRDRNWGTIPGQLQNVKMDVREDSFRISYVATHRHGEPTPDPSQEGNLTRDSSNAAPFSGEGGGGSNEFIHFVWHGEIIGESDGTIRFTLDGEAKTAFLKNRIGFCVLHPIRECAGAPCRVEYVDGTSKTVAFPKLVAAEQPVKDIHDLKSIAHEALPGVWAEVGFEGEVFEMEDQRNWIDASYKTFCTPLRLPFPVEIKAGQKMRQSVTVKPVQMPDARCQMTDFKIAAESENRATHIVNIEFGSSATPLLPIGLGAPSHKELPFERQVKRLQRLKLGHLRLDLGLAEPEWQAELRLHASHAMDIGVPLEVALHFPNASRTLLGEVIAALAPLRSDLLRFVLFQDGTTAAPERLLRLARKRLVEAFASVSVGGGTNADFYQLNQFRPPAELCDFICWSMNPQVHAFDNASLAETSSAIPAQIESARDYFPGKLLVVSPVTLKPRFNPVAMGKETALPPNELPSQVDPRQMSLFGAGWTLAAFKYLAESGVDSVTFYETTGWRGVMETETGSPLPDKFRSIPGGVFPLYHVLADLGEFAGGEIVVSRSSDPLRVEGLVIRKGDRQRMMLANMTEKPQTAIANNLRGIARLKRLNETNAELAMREPEKFRAETGEAFQVWETGVELNLMPYEVTRMDF